METHALLVFGSSGIRCQRTYAVMNYQSSVIVDIIGIIVCSAKHMDDQNDLISHTSKYLYPICVSGKNEGTVTF